MSRLKTSFWNHKYVGLFSGNRDPIAVMIERARRVVLDSLESGWNGPPFDPFELAEALGIDVIPCSSVRDARLVSLGKRAFRIEYNPIWPASRIRFSVAHEIAHTFFPDCREAIRYRQSRVEISRNEWQIEMLCNVGASELLMPVDNFPEMERDDLTIDQILRLREEFKVSTEAVLSRCVRRSHFPIAAFAVSMQGKQQSAFRVDYLRQSGWCSRVRTGAKVPAESVVNECIVIGHTAKGLETWLKCDGSVRVECVALPPYIGRDRPRVVGLMVPSHSLSGSFGKIRCLVGDATNPRGKDHRIIAHVVNNATPRWGGGFAKVIRRKWKGVQDDFLNWVGCDPNRLSLGNCRRFDVESDVSVFSMIAQHGYGPSKRPRIRYRQLQKCLGELAQLAKEVSGSIHLPRIGCGQAGGNWAIVSEIIESELCRRGIEVTVYDLENESNRWTSSDSQITFCL